MKTKDFLGHEWDIECMGCAVADGSMSVPGGFIYRSQHFCVHQDPLIPLPGFLVIASLRHIRSIAEMDDAEYQEFASLVRVTHKAIKQVTQIEHLTLVQEESSIHFHLWFFPWTEEVIEKYGPPSLAKIREIMAKYKKQVIDEAEWAMLQKSIKEIKSNLEGGIYEHK
ncbi:MAG: HIT family hydrolase [Chloroflexi bacterium]|nr:HIT family hydrolase [Chloroflexota bacterium]